MTRGEILEESYSQVQVVRVVGSTLCRLLLMVFLHPWQGQPNTQEDDYEGQDDWLQSGDAFGLDYSAHNKRQASLWSAMFRK